MKTFFSVFFGAFCAIMAAAAVLYFIKEYQDTEGARQLLQETRSASERLNTTYAGIPSPAPQETTLNGRPAGTKSEATLVQSVTIKTADGELAIPAGKTVHTVNEKSPPGTVVVSYEGYAFIIPLAAIGAASR